MFPIVHLYPRSHVCCLHDIPLTMITTSTSPSFILNHPIISLNYWPATCEIPAWKYKYFLVAIGRAGAECNVIYNSGEVNSPPRGTSASAYRQEINDGDACYRYLQYGTPTLRELYSWWPCLDLNHDVLCKQFSRKRRYPDQLEAQLLLA